MGARNPLPVLMATANGLPFWENTRSARPSPFMSVRLASVLAVPVAVLPAVIRVAGLGALADCTVAARDAPAGVTLVVADGAAVTSDDAGVTAVEQWPP